jgi:hypothetical protein
MIGSLVGVTFNIRSAVGVGGGLFLVLGSRVTVAGVVP